MDLNPDINSNGSELVNSRQILLLVDSESAQDRIQALEILGQLLKGIFSNSEHEVNSAAYNSLKISISFSILTRCDDISPVVRAKALCILSQTMGRILKILHENKNISTLETEKIEEIALETDLGVNGNHRYFWHSMTSSHERRKELTAVLHRRTGDHYVAARKAAFSALANAMMFHHSFVTQANLACLKSSASDVSAVIRKQAIQLISELLEARKRDDRVMEIWLMSVLHLTDDLDISVNSKALSALEDVFLGEAFSPLSAHGKLPMYLLKMLSGKFSPYQKFLKNAFVKWKLMNKLKTEMNEQLKIYIGTEWEDSVWLYVSFLPSDHPIPYEFACLCIDRLKHIQRTKEYPQSTVHILEVLLHVSQCLPAEKLDAVHSIIRVELETFSVPSEFIPMWIDIHFKIHKHKETKSEFDAFSSRIIQKCLRRLVEAESKDLTPRSLTEDLLIKILCTMSELCLFCPSQVTTTLVTILKKYNACTLSSDSSGTTEAHFTGLSSKLKAHALVALGKICLLDQSLALELLSVAAQELLFSKEDVIRNNTSVILTDLCKRYPSFTDMCIPLICQSLKDNVCIIRYQTIIFLTSLLKNDNILIKWQYSLFFGLLSALVDKKSAIRQISEYALCQLPRKNKSVFYDFFIDSIFVLNLFAPPDNGRRIQLVEKFIIFSIPGEGSRKKRMIIYRFLLMFMSVKEKANVVDQICRIMMNIAQSVYPLNARTECIIRDCFSILTCYEIRLINVQDVENEDDGGKAAGTELVSRRLAIINPVILAISSLKNVVGDSNSNIVHDIILFVKDLLSDFIDDMKDILAADNILLQQMEYEIKKDAEEERRNCQIRKESLQSINKTA